MDRKLTGTQYCLLALIPYTRPNIEFTFARKRFFREVALRDRQHEKAIRHGFYNALRQGLVTEDDTGMIRLTQKGARKIAPFTARHLPNSNLMVIFDIPESDRWARSHLRSLLRELSFTQIQKSVWVCQYDHRSLIEMEIEHLQMASFVKIYECYNLK